MFDFHNHFTSDNAILKTGTLLPAFYCGQNLEKEIFASEIGLDKRFISKMSKEKQIDLFKNCLTTAKELDIPVHIHCVGFVKETLDCLKKANLKEKTVLWHRFNSSYEIAKELRKLGIIISISAEYNKDISILYNNNNLLVFETDYEGNSKEEHELMLTKIYLKASKALNLSIEELDERIKKEGLIQISPSHIKDN